MKVKEISMKIVVVYEDLQFKYVQELNKLLYDARVKLIKSKLYLG